MASFASVMKLENHLMVILISKLSLDSGALMTAGEELQRCEPLRFLTKDGK